MPRWVPLRLRRFYFRHELPVKVGAVAVVVLALVAAMHDTTKPVSARPQDRPAGGGWQGTDADENTPVALVDPSTETASLRLPVDGGWFAVSSIGYRPTPAGEQSDPVADAARAGSVAAGSRGRVVVLSARGAGEAKVELVVDDGAPRGLPVGYDAVTDIDLDNALAGLVFESAGRARAMVPMETRSRRYRLRVARAEGGVTERFRLDVWPRRADRAMVVRRRASARG